ncbi:MAG TPA: hypothetical protein VEQ41_09010 [Solirubrobacterales bacterium]|nr:hypothetical protein [Solirubrobacterales bacterium]
MPGKKVGPLVLVAPAATAALTNSPARSGWWRIAVTLSLARKSGRSSRAETLRTTICPVLTSPGPTPGVACTTAITACSRIATIRSAAARDRRSFVTVKRRLAVSFGTSCVASPRTTTVRSCAPAAAGSSKASAKKAISGVFRTRDDMGGGLRGEHDSRPPPG